MDTNPGNLPLQLSSFVGREREMAEVKRLLSRTRLLTLTGCGGCGKTRLALQVAADMIDSYPDGVRLVDLAPVADPLAVARRIASALDVREQGGQSLLSTLVASLRDRRLLLLLDNCEHLIEAAAAVSDALLRGCPRLRILATSRENLRIESEVVYRVPSLQLPDARQSTRGDELLKADAVRLFVERARGVLDDFTLTTDNARSVLEICCQLEGIPLAIELAAARINALSAEQIAARLADRFRLLTGGHRTALPRHRTLRASLEWSYDLLTDAERMLFRRLAVFAGGWTVEAADVICSDKSFKPAQVEECLIALVSKSLVTFHAREGEARYRMLETLRAFAMEQLAAAGESQLLRERHLDYIRMLAEHFATYIREGREQVAWLNRIEAELDNIRAALSWSEAGGAGWHGLALAGSLLRFWEAHSHLSEGRVWLRKMLKISQDAPALVRAQGLHTASWMEMHDEQYILARELAAESLSLFRAAGNQTQAASVLQTMGYIAKYLQDPKLALSLHAECLAIGRILQDPFMIFWGLVSTAEDRFLRGERDQIVPLLGEALAIATRIENIWAVANVTRMRGDVAFATGQLATAHSLYVQAIELRRVMGHKAAIVRHTRALGKVVLAQGDDVQALALFHESLKLAREAVLPDETVIGLAAIAGLAARRGADAEAVRLAAAVSALLDSHHLKLAYGHNAYETDQVDFDECMARLIGRCDPPVFAGAWAAGCVMTMEQACAEALLIAAMPVIQRSSPEPPAATNLAGLSAREVDVLRLLGRGLSNAQIAAQLVISPRTVNAHLRSIYGKLDVSSRIAAARFATENGIV